MFNEFYFNIKHHPRSKMRHINELSRALINRSEDTEAEVLITMREEDPVLNMQRTNLKLKMIVSILSRNDLERSVAEEAMVR
jgi:hypothetical protein